MNLTTVYGVIIMDYPSELILLCCLFSTALIGLLIVKRTILSARHVTLARLTIGETLIYASLAML
jgi:hypothetical protein